MRIPQIRSIPESRPAPTGSIPLPGLVNLARSPMTMTEARAYELTVRIFADIGKRLESGLKALHSLQPRIRSKKKFCQFAVRIFEISRDHSIAVASALKESHAEQVVLQAQRPKQVNRQRRPKHDLNTRAALNSNLFVVPAAIPVVTMAEMIGHVRRNTHVASSRRIAYATAH